jgi:hypothetical protein
MNFSIEHLLSYVTVLSKAFRLRFTFLFNNVFVFQFYLSKYLSLVEVMMTEIIQVKTESTSKFLSKVMEFSYEKKIKNLFY